MNTGASINGRLLAQTAVTLQSSTVQSTGLAGNQTVNATVSTQKRSIRYTAKLF